MDIEEIKDRIEEKVRESVAKINARFKSKIFPEPRVRFDLADETDFKSGTASYDRWDVRFNLKVAAVNGEKFINQTVPHEIAHLADYHYFREWGHGKTWKYIMTNVFGLSPDRCTDYDLPPDVKRNKKRTFIYICACPEKIPVGIRMHTIIQGGRKKFCVHCHRQIQFEAYAGKI